jgi:signal transduction histidine kinase
LKRILSWLRPWFVPVSLVGLAVLLTVPWTLLVFRAAYQRDVLENAQALARRVEINLTITPLNPRSEAEAVRAVRTELLSDPSVQTVAFYNVSRLPDVRYLAIVTKRSATVPQLSVEQIDQLQNVGPMQTKNEDTIGYLIPWKREGRIVGVTYVEMSREVLGRAFWSKELPLLKRVMAWTATAILALSGVGIFAYRVWQKAGHVEERAELARQGMMAERGLTAAVLAHEIRNPLQALRFQLHSLRRNAENPDRVAGTAETIDSELLRIQQLVTDYLEHEKAVSLRVQRVDLAEAARSLKRVMEEMLRQSDTKLVIESTPDGEPVYALCDPHALRQVLMNLVLNAQQAMKQGGAITIRIGREDPFGTIDVIDTGPGIPEEMKARLFKPFQTSKHDGHGIGLALVKRFADNFGGSVSVDSQTGKGTAFHLKLPLAGHDELLGQAGVGMVNAPSAVAPVPVVALTEHETEPEVALGGETRSPSGRG